MTMTEETTSISEPATRDVMLAVRRGTLGKCPACGNGKLYQRYLKVADTCPSCAEELHHHRADDAPPYFTILIAGHFIVAGVMMVEERFQPDYWVHLALWFPLTMGICLWMLPHIKGALVGLQWALRMHGFGDSIGADDKSGGPSAVEPPLAVQTADR